MYNWFDLINLLTQYVKYALKFKVRLAKNITVSFIEFEN